MLQAQEICLPLASQMLDKVFKKASYLHFHFLLEFLLDKFQVLVRLGLLWMFMASIFHRQS